MSRCRVTHPDHPPTVLHLDSAGMVQWVALGYTVEIQPPTVPKPVYAEPKLESEPTEQEQPR